MPDIRTFDLNLLKVFLAVSQSGSVSRAAGELGLSQPAVSNALNRLRRQLGDPLFVRTPRGMEPTPRAEQLKAFIEEGLATLRTGLTADTAFDPAISRRRFNLLMSDIGEMTFLPLLLAMIERSAPRVALSIVEAPLAEYGDRLDSGVVDLAVGWIHLGQSFASQRLRASRQMVLLSRDHPMLEEGPSGELRISYENYLRATHVTVKPPSAARVPSQLSLGAHHEKLRIALTLPHTAVLPPVISGTRLVATISDALAAHFVEHDDLCLCEAPFPAEPIEIRQWWNRRNDCEPGHAWLRGLLVRAGQLLEASKHGCAEPIESLKRRAAP